MDVTLWFSYLRQRRGTSQLHPGCWAETLEKGVGCLNPRLFQVWWLPRPERSSHWGTHGGWETGSPTKEAQGIPQGQRSSPTASPMWNEGGVEASVRRLTRWWEEGQSWLELECSSGGAEKWLDSGKCWKVEPTRFANGLTLAREIRDDAKVRASLFIEMEKIVGRPGFTLQWLEAPLEK